VGTNNLTQVVSGQDPAPSDLNQYYSALVGDLIPRGANGTIQASGADMGQRAYPWRRGYFDELFLGGVSLSTQSGTGQALKNGVVKGKSPNNRPKMCGWMLQAGASGVVLKASDDAPLEVKLDGESYQLTEDLTGGTPLPSNLSITPSATGNNIWQGHKPVWPCGGGPWNLDTSSGENSPPVGKANGDIFTFKFSDGGETEYVVAYRAKTFTTAGAFDDHAAVFGTRGCINTSSTDWTSNFGNDLSGDGAGEIIRTGYVFVDPTTATWTLSIEKRVVGSAHHQLPDANDYATGDMVFRESDHYWYRHDGSSWQETSRVFLGICAIDGGAVEGVMGVRSEEALAEMGSFTDALGLGIVSIINLNNGRTAMESVTLAPASDLENSVEFRPAGFLSGQAHETFGNGWEIDASEFANEDGLHVIYQDCDTHELIIEKDLVPHWIYREKENGRPSMILAHPNKHAIYLAMINRRTISSNTYWGGSKGVSYSGNNGFYAPTIMGSDGPRSVEGTLATHGRYTSETGARSYVRNSTDSSLEAASPLFIELDFDEIFEPIVDAGIAAEISLTNLLTGTTTTSTSLKMEWLVNVDTLAKVFLRLTTRQ